MSNNIEFYDLCLEQGDLRVVWEWLGEGWNGDYAPEDSDDKPLLRFTCYQHIPAPIPDGCEDCEHATHIWAQMDDGSYCTRMPVATPVPILARAAAVILEEVRRAIDGGGSVRKSLERLSWLCPEDFV